jgi:hypothetical protein
VLEEVTGLPVDLEWPVLIEVVDIKPFHTFGWYYNRALLTTIAWMAVPI